VLAIHLSVLGQICPRFFSQIDQKMCKKGGSELCVQKMVWYKVDMLFEACHCGSPAARKQKCDRMEVLFPLGWSSSKLKAHRLKVSPISAELNHRGAVIFWEKSDKVFHVGRSWGMSLPRLGPLGKH
jgi:hypothetical protein